MKEIKNICCLDSVYSLLIYLLLFPQKRFETFFFVSDGVAESVRNKLPNVKYIPNPPHNANRISVFFFHIYIYIYLFIFTSIKKIPKGLPTYGHDFLKWSDYFVHSTKSFILIEDGIGNYVYPDQFYKKYRESLFYHLLVKIFPMFTLPFGLSKNVEKIYLTNIAKIPEIIANKVQLIDIKDLWNRLSKEEQRWILSIYIEEKEIDDLLTTKRSVLLLTQCFSEDGLWTEEEKICTYKNLLKPYSLEDVIIKTHPREKTNYKKIFPQVMVIDSPIPFQLLNVLTLNLKTAITYHSTAIFCLADTVEKIMVASSDDVKKKGIRPIL